MRTIWKWTLDKPVIRMPQGSEVLCVQMQGGKPQVWALCSPDATPVERRFNIVGTGIKLEDDLGDYVGTFQIHDLVFHVFVEPD